MDENLKFALDIMNYQLPYILSHIDSPKNAKIYLNARYDLVDNIELHAKDFNGAINILARAINGPSMPKIEWDLFGNKRRYRKLAIDHVTDVMQSVYARFITGGSSYHGIR